MQFFQENQETPVVQSLRAVQELNENTKIGPLVVKEPSYARVFETFGIDYCCKGKMTLKEACMDKNLDVSKVLEQLEEALKTSPEVNWDKMPVNELIAHIIVKHHHYLREELPRLSLLISKVATKHGYTHPELLALQSTFEIFKQDQLEHIEKEESTFFPACEQLLVSQNASELTKKTLKESLNSLDEEHLETGEALEKMRRLMNDYIPPKHACASYIVMLDRLDSLELDLHEHVHKENHILFPKALQFLH